MTPVGVLITIRPHFCQKEITCPVVFLEKSPDMLRFKYRIFKKMNTTQLPKEILSIYSLYQTVIVECKPYRSLTVILFFFLFANKISKKLENACLIELN